MLLPGPRHSVVYLRLGAPATLATEGPGARVRVVRDSGYPHDLKVSPGRAARLKPGRVFTPVVDAGAAVTLDADTGDATPSGGDDIGAEALVLCANCFAEMWRRPLAWPTSARALDETEAAFWTDTSAHACPRCRAAAAKPH